MIYEYQHEGISHSVLSAVCTLIDSEPLIHCQTTRFSVYKSL